MRRGHATDPGAKEGAIPTPVYPVVLCGGAGERLWPVSRPWRPKPFVKLIGDRSGFQAALQRAAALVGEVGEIVICGSAGHADTIRNQRDGVHVGTTLLEPAGRGTAAAIAAAAAWALRRQPDAVLVALPADHHIPDITAFRDAVLSVIEAVRGGGVATLGVRPNSPAPGMGYIAPGEGAGPLKPIAAFIEKPPPAQAAALIERGALWNCGIFIGRADVLLAELQRRAPSVTRAVDAALAAVVPVEGELRLGEAFADAPAISFDRAVMEGIDCGLVAPVDLPWADLGAWDAVWNAMPRDAGGLSLWGDAQATESSDVLARAAPGMRVAVVGASRLAVIVEPDAVLVCDLEHAQAVRDLAGTAPRRFRDLAEASVAYDGWLRTAALPLWATVGVDPATGAFREALTWHGAPHDPRRRTRVLARQAFVYATAARDGVPGPWVRAAREGFAYFQRHARRSDGLYAACLDLDGRPTDPEARLYEQAFVILALAALQAAGADGQDHAVEAEAVRGRLAVFRNGAGGFREVGPQPFQANAQMHLFEAALAWESADPAWSPLADELAELALDRFICAETGALREFYDADWRPLTGDDGLIEPGHQFEWAWLLERWGRARGEARARAAAQRLFAVGRRGFDAARGVVVDALDDGLGVRHAGARLWPQTEHLKAALILGEDAAALEAANSLALYLDTPVRGVWRERMRPDGGFVEEPSPATSLYHLFVAMRELAQAC